MLIDRAFKFAGMFVIGVGLALLVVAGTDWIV